MPKDVNVPLGMIAVLSLHAVQFYGHLGSGILILLHILEGTQILSQYISSLRASPKCPRLKGAETLTDWDQK